MRVQADNPDRGFYAQGEWTAGSDTLALPGFFRLIISAHAVRNEAVDSKAFQDWLAAVLRQLDGLSRSSTIVLRVSYSGTHAVPHKRSHDPPSCAVLEAQMTKLFGSMSADQKVKIAAVEIGMLGHDGEWHCQAGKGACALADKTGVYSLRLSQLLVDIVREQLPDTPVLVRRTEVWRDARAREALDQKKAPRVGFFNDCFLTGDTDVGTYKTAAERPPFAAELQQAGAHFGGETCDPKENLPARYALSGGAGKWSTWDELQAFHVSYLHDEFGARATAAWKTGWARDIGGPGANHAYQTISAYLGYRLVVQSATVSSAPDRAGTTVTVKIRNEGFAVPMRPRELLLAVVRPGQVPTLLRQDSPQTTDKLVPGQNVDVVFAGIHFPDDVHAGDELRLVTQLHKSTFSEARAFQDRLCAVSSQERDAMADCEAHNRTNRLGVTVP